jgi:hypothetical protein
MTDNKTVDFKPDEVVGTINFKIRKGYAPNQTTKVDGFIVTTDKNPYIMIWRETEYEAVIIAFTRYLERLTEIKEANEAKATNSNN